MKDLNKISPKEITDPDVYFNRRKFIQRGILAASVVATGMVYRRLNRPATGETETARIEGLTTTAANDPDGFHAADKATSFQDITHYNNFYEFSTEKEEVVEAATDFDTKSWQVSVEGLVKNPQVFHIRDLLEISPPEERIYRMRCVEGWSMVIPWAGFSLSKLLDMVEPTNDAKFVAFESLLDPKRMAAKTTVCPCRWRGSASRTRPSAPLTLRP